MPTENRGMVVWREKSCHIAMPFFIGKAYRNYRRSYGKMDRNSDGTFAKGNPGGPGRKPIPYSITSMLRAYGDTVLPDGRTRAQALAEMLWDRALGAEDRAVAEYIADRLDGKPKERVEMSEARYKKVILVTEEDGQPDSAGAPEAAAVHTESG